MKILFLTTHFNNGGITSYVLSLAKGLRGKGHSAVVVSSGGERVPDLRKYDIPHFTVDVQTKSELSLKVYLSLNKVCRLIHEQQIDVIHAQTRVTQVIARLAGQITGCPCVTTCHGFFKKRLGRYLYPCWGEAVIAISEAVRHHLEKDFDVDAQRIALIPNGVDVNDFPAMDHELKKMKKRKMNLKSGAVIGIIARLSEVKGHFYLIKAMHQVVHEYRDANLLIVGGGKMESSLRKLVRQLGLEDNVKFLPTVNRTADILPLFDIFIMPSLQEGLGLSVLEAQAVGIPVIASNVGGLPSLIEHGKTGLLVQPADAVDLSKALLDLLADRSKRVEMGAAGYRSVCQNFSLDSMVHQTVNLYQKVRKGD